MQPSEPKENRDSPNQWRFQHGTLLKERYVIVEKIGSGGMGEVYKAYDKKYQNRLVALKKLTKPTEQQKKRFVQEYKFLSTVHHNNLIRALDYFTLDTHLFMVLEFAQGYSLEQFLTSGQDIFSLAEKISIANKVSRAVEILNVGGILHRDIKPENIMIAPDKGEVKLLDLGLGKDLGNQDNTLTVNKAILGTLPYLSPEQAEGGFSAQSDVFSLGVTLYQFFLFLPHSPFSDTTSFAIILKIARFSPPSLFAKVSETRKLAGKQLVAYQQISAILEKAMAKAPQDRWQSAGEMADHFAQVCSSLLEESDKLPCQHQSLLNLAEEIDDNLLQTLKKIRKEESEISPPSVCAKTSRGRRQRRQKKSSSRPLWLPIVVVICVLAGLVGVLWFAHPSSGNSVRLQQISSSLEKYLKHYNKREYPAAYQLLQSCLQKDNDPRLVGYQALMLYHGQGVSQNVTQSYHLLEKIYPALVKSKDPHSYYILAIAHWEGQGTKQKKRRAVGYLQEAAYIGHTLAMKKLADIYYHGTELKSDLSKALLWYQKAAQGGNIEAAYHVGNIHLQGQSSQSDEKLAIRWLSEAAKHHHPQAISQLAHWHFQQWQQNKQSYQPAQKWLLRAAQRGDISAMMQLAKLYRQEPNLGQFKESLHWLEQAATQGHLPAMLELAKLYQHEPQLRKNQDKSYHWYQQAALQGASQALNYVVNFVVNHPHKKLSPEDLTCLEKAAEQGNLVALRILGKTYYYGERGMELNFSKAFRWLQQAAQEGDEKAMRNLSEMYFFGKGVAVDRKKSEYWREQSRLRQSQK